MTAALILAIATPATGAMAESVDGIQPAEETQPAAERQAQAIYLAEIPDLTVGMFAEIAASATSGLPLALVASGSCSLQEKDGSPVAIATAAGACTIAARQDGDDTWLPAPAATVAFDFTSAPVILEPKLGKPVVAPGGKVQLTVTVSGAQGHVPAPSGAAIVEIEGTTAPVASADLGSDGVARTEFLAPDKAGDYDLSVTYVGDAGYDGGRARPLVLHVTDDDNTATGDGVVLSARPATSNDGDPVTFTFDVSPLNDGAVTLEWPGHSQQIPTKKRASFSITTQALHPGDYAVTAAYRFVDTGGTLVTSSDSVTVSVDAQDKDLPSVIDPGVGGAFVGNTMVLRSPLTSDQDSAPVIYARAGQAVHLVVSTLPSATSQLVRLQQASPPWLTIGYAQKMADGRYALPTFIPASPGSAYLRVVPYGQDPLYALLRVRSASDYEPATPSGYPTDGMGLVWKGFKAIVTKGLEKVPGVGEPLGWLVGMLLGLGDAPPPEPLAEVKDMLVNQQRALTSIERKADDIIALIKDEACTARTKEADAGVDVIRSSYERLQLLVTAPPKMRPKAKDWQEWSVKATGTLDDAIRKVNTGLMGTSTEGALQACAKAYLAKWQAGQYPSLGEQRFYGDLHQILNYYQGYQIMGLTALIEAYHHQAAMEWKAAEKDATNPRAVFAPDNIDQVCDPTPGVAKDYEPGLECLSARDSARKTYGYLVDQIVRAGAGFSMNPKAQSKAGPLISTQLGADLVWALDIEDFGIERTLGTTGTSFADGRNSAYGYQGWRPVNQDEWIQLLDINNVRKETLPPELVTRGTWTVADMLRMRGLAIKGNRILYTGDSVGTNSDALSFHMSAATWAGPIKGVTMLSDPAWRAMCLLDTAMTYPNLTQVTPGQVPHPVRCDSTTAGPSTLMQLTGYDDKITWRVKIPMAENTEAATWSVPSFYSGRFTFYSRGRAGFSDVWGLSKLDVVTPPKWLYKADGSVQAAENARWPVLKLTDGRCSPTTLGSGRGAVTLSPGPRNVAGVPSMCGDDFGAWVRTFLPDPPAQPGS